MERVLTYAQALLEATEQEMERDPSVILFGIGVDDFKGTWGTTKDLLLRVGHSQLDVDLFERNPGVPHGQPRPQAPARGVLVADYQLIAHGLPTPQSSVMIEKFAGVRGMVRSEFLDLNHTSKLMILVSLMIPKFARDAGGKGGRTSESGH